MLTLRYALLLFVCYFLVFALYYRYYFRPRLYLMIRSSGSSVAGAKARGGRKKACRGGSMP